MLIFGRRTNNDSSAIKLEKISSIKLKGIEKQTKKKVEPSER